MLKTRNPEKLEGCRTESSPTLVNAPDRDDRGRFEG